VVFKLGGELLEATSRLRAIARAIARASRTTPLVVVHGGGREIDRALAQAGIPKRQVDGLRVTDEATLDIVVGVLAGAVNTRLVSAVNAAGGAAVGLTGADAGTCRVVRAPRHRSTTGELVDLGLVGRPVANGKPGLVTALVSRGFVPVVASIGASRDGTLYNVNADTLAGHLAAQLHARRLIIAGATAGVLDDGGRTLASIDRAEVKRAAAAGTVNAGMVAKLTACSVALAGGVGDVLIADGRDTSGLAPLLTGGAAARQTVWTRVTN
jgi:acetylglutamate kinase